MQAGPLESGINFNIDPAVCNLPGLVVTNLRVAQAVPGPDCRPDYEQYLPDAYNVASKLTATVTPDADNIFRFELTLRTMK